MSTEEVLQALTRYTKETNDSERQTATKLGVNRMTLSTWLHGKEPPQKCTLARLAGFFRRVGYLSRLDVVLRAVPGTGGVEFTILTKDWRHHLVSVSQRFCNGRSWICGE